MPVDVSRLRALRAPSFSRLRGAGRRRAVRGTVLPRTVGVRALSFRRVGIVAGSVVGGLIALDLVALLVTAWFGAELLDPAEVARAIEELKR